MVVPLVVVISDSVVTRSHIRHKLTIVVSFSLHIVRILSMMCMSFLRSCGIVRMPLYFIVMLYCVVKFHRWLAHVLVKM